MRWKMTLNNPKTLKSQKCTVVNSHLRRGYFTKFSAHMLCLSANLFRDQYRLVILVN